MSRFSFLLGSTDFGFHSTIQSLRQLASIILAVITLAIETLAEDVDGATNSIYLVNGTILRRWSTGRIVGNGTLVDNGTSTGTGTYLGNGSFSDLPTYPANSKCGAARVFVFSGDERIGIFATCLNGPGDLCSKPPLPALPDI
ncbi:hypothetical protein C8F04DRAFT_1259786 [Mycena alexandri]|uniref:Uncharacterized protein n=1 Tax=Mycena alexandri TaxID=1745969 RepID=A0AAD6SVH9_9AGAR|nr:hypothetical protein C8F04DRAFT_1259786 [Mycena alexandri]